MMRALGGTRSLPIDVLKVVASQLIVLHHLVLYGPMAEHAAPLWPGLFNWLEVHARIVVQVFLVVGGFLAGQRLLPGCGVSSKALLPQLFSRYLRLALPLVAALLLAIVAAALARQWMPDEWIPVAPGMLQLLLHVLLLQDLAGVEALSAGIWYVAIALQLHALLLLTLDLVPAPAALGLRSGAWDGTALLPWLLAGGVAVSALWFNRQPAWDVAAPYFLAAYGLGVLVAWSPGGRSARLACAAAMTLVVVALLVEWRDRLALALTVTIVLWAWQAWVQHRSGHAVSQPRTGHGALWRGIAALSQSSFALFLVHFPVVMVVNALFTRLVPPAPWPQMAGVLLAWLASIAAGELFFRHVERPMTRWVDRRRPA